MSLLPISWKRSIQSLAFVGGLWFTSNANAQNIQIQTVSNNNPSGPGSLFDAIDRADIAPRNGTIQVIEFDPRVTGTITLTKELPVLNNNIVIDGPTDRQITINGGNITRVFFAYLGTITIRNLNIVSGNALGGQGGNSQSGGGGGGGGLGAGGGLFVSNFAAVTLQNVNFQNNNAIGGNGGNSTGNPNLLLFFGTSGGGGGGMGGKGGNVGILASGGGGGGGLYGSAGASLFEAGGGGGGRGTDGASDFGLHGGGGGSTITPGIIGAFGGAGGTPSGGNGGVAGAKGGAGGDSGGGGGGGAGNPGILTPGGAGGRGGGGGGSGQGPGGNGGDYGGGGGAASNTRNTTGVVLTNASYPGGNGGYGGGGGGGALGGAGGIGGFGAGSGGSSTTAQGSNGGNGGSGLGGSVFVQQGGALTIVDGSNVGGSAAAGIGGSGLTVGTNGIAAGASMYLDNVQTIYRISANSTSIIDNSISGTGGMTVQAANTKVGGGNLILTGASNYTGPTQIDSATLTVNGSITSNVTVGVNGTLMGGGAVGPTLVHGTVSPGNLSTLTVNGNFTQGHDGTYLADINTISGSNDKINVNGAASIAGTLLVVPVPGNYIAGERWIVLNATRGLSGTYENVIVSPTVSQPIVDLITPNQVILATALTPAQALALAQTFNQRSTLLTLLDGNLPKSLDNTLNNVLSVPNQQIGNALDQLSGAIYGSLMGYSRMNALQTGQMLYDQLYSTLRGPFNCNDPDADGALSNGWSAWMKGRAGMTHIPGDGNATGSNVGNGGLLFGIDRWFSADTRIGGYFGYSLSRYTENTNYLEETARINSYDVGLSFSQTVNSWYALGNVGYGYNGYNMTRSVNFNVLTGLAESNYSGHLFNAGVETGYNIQMGDFSATPLVGLQYLNLQNNSFSETGTLGATNLTGGSQQLSSLWTSIGSRFAYCYDWRGMNLQTNVQGRYLHDMLGENRGELMQFSGGGSPFMVLGTRTGQDFAWAGCGVSLNADFVRLSLDYTNLYSTKQDTNMGTASIEIHW